MTTPKKDFVIKIPHAIDFKDLRLQRHPDGRIQLNMELITDICEANNVDPQEYFASSEDSLATLILNWYQAHKQNGGAEDPVAEDLIKEAMAEYTEGQSQSRH